MKTQYFGEYNEQQENTLPAIEITGKVKVHCIKNNYLVYLKTESGTIYDLPMFMTKYVNRTVAIIARIYNKIHTVKTNDGVIQKTYNKLVVIRARPIDILDEELEELNLE